ncbi:hypothetical protein [Rubrivirga sp.]|uniref:hypothetical protein n=1 Tax=Rubrivirga sp. TaxID=1885344 RepID=UPI003B51CB3F
MSTSRLLLLALLGTVPLAAQAQAPEIRRVLSPALPDTVTSDALDEVNGRATLRATGASYTGVVRDRWPNGRLKLLRSVEDGRAAGLWTEWYESGTVRYLAEWHPEGPGEGAWFYFHESGVVRDRTVYRRDTPVGPSEGWHSNGRKAFEGIYDKQGNRVGIWRWWADDGRVEREVTYAEGRAESVAATWNVNSPVPCLTPCLLAPGVLSTNAEEFRPVFAPEGREAFLTRRPPGGVQQIYVSTYESGRWGEPVLAPFSTDVEEELAISADGRRVVFASRRSMRDRQADLSDNVWTAERTVGGWSEPVALPRAINRPRPSGDGWPVGSEFAGALLPDGSLIFWSALRDAADADLFIAPARGTLFGRPVPLGPTINTAAFESAPAVSPDGRYLVFQRSGAADGAGQEDLYVAERTPDGWGAARRIDAGVSSAANESFPSFTPDGRSLVFSSDRGGPWSVYIVAVQSLSFDGSP